MRIVLSIKLFMLLSGIERKMAVESLAGLHRYAAKQKSKEKENATVILADDDALHVFAGCSGHCG
jgi:hypothetical protein